MLTVVLDTQVWLDWLVFADRAVAPLRDAQANGRIRIAVDDACEAELVRVLGYGLGRFTQAEDAQRRHLERYRALTHRVVTRLATGLPACRDRDDQKFLELAAQSGAMLLVTRDNALLQMRRHGLPFLIATPDDPDTRRLISEGSD